MEIKDLTWILKERFDATNLDQIKSFLDYYKNFPWEELDPKTSELARNKFYQLGENALNDLYGYRESRVPFFALLTDMWSEKRMPKTLEPLTLKYKQQYMSGLQLVATTSGLGARVNANEFENTLNWWFNNSDGVLTTRFIQPLELYGLCDEEEICQFWGITHSPQGHNYKARKVKKNKTMLLKLCDNPQDLLSTQKQIMPDWEARRSLLDCVAWMYCPELEFKITKFGEDKTWCRSIYLIDRTTFEEVVEDDGPGGIAGSYPGIEVGTKLPLAYEQARSSIK